LNSDAWALKGKVAITLSKALEEFSDEEIEHLKEEGIIYQPREDALAIL